jgi:hypothetical protein
VIDLAARREAPSVIEKVAKPVAPGPFPIHIPCKPEFLTEWATADAEVAEIVTRYQTVLDIRSQEEATAVVASVCAEIDRLTRAEQPVRQFERISTKLSEALAA